jgi:hypothetical protein
VCSLWLSNLPLWVTYMASEYTLVAFTLYTYLSIVNPIRHRVLFTRRFTAGCLSGVWTGSLLFVATYGLGASRIVNNLCYVGYAFVSATAKQAFGVLRFVLFIVVPLCVYFCCYCHMAVRLSRRNKIVCPLTLTRATATATPSQTTTGHVSCHMDNEIHEEADEAQVNIDVSKLFVVDLKVHNNLDKNNVHDKLETEAADRQAHKQMSTTSQSEFYDTTKNNDKERQKTAKGAFSKVNVNVFRTLTYMLVTHTVTWGGNQYQNLAFTFGRSLKTTSLSYQLLLLAVYFSSCINPVIYLVKYDNLRHAARLLLCNIIHYCR